MSNYRTDKTDMIQQDSEKIFESGSWESYVSKYLTLDRNGNPLGVKDSALRKTIIEIKGSYDGGEPLIKWNNRSDGGGENNRKFRVTKQIYNSETKTLRLEIEHNGVVDFEVYLEDSGNEYKPLRRDGREDIYSKITVDGSKLEALVAEKITDSYNYTYFSYLEYDKQFEKARVMLDEKTYTQKQIDKQVKELTKAKNNLINIQSEIGLIKKVVNGNYQATAMLAYDALLREMLSCQKYVSGRSNKLEYASIYKNKNILGKLTNNYKMTLTDNPLFAIIPTDKLNNFVTNQTYDVINKKFGGKDE